MKLLLDECTPQRLKDDFTGHEVFTVDDVGLRGVKNGELLRAAAGNFEAVITVDRKMPLEQNVSGLDLALALNVFGSQALQISTVEVACSQGARCLKDYQTRRSDRNRVC